MTRFALLFVLALALAACGGDTQDAGTSSTDTTPASFEMAADIPDATNVFRAKKKPVGEEVVVVGRVRDLTQGFAAFTMIDEVMEYCGQGAEQCGCKTPWDYCCIQPEEVNEASLPVEFRDAKGQPVETDDAGLRLLDLVVVKGKLEKTQSGGLVLVTNTGWFQRERPKLPDGIEWP